MKIKFEMEIEIQDMEDITENYREELLENIGKQESDFTNDKDLIRSYVWSVLGSNLEYDGFGVQLNNITMISSEE